MINNPVRKSEVESLLALWGWSDVLREIKQLAEERATAADIDGGPYGVWFADVVRVLAKFD